MVLNSACVIVSVCPFCQTVGIQVKGLVTDGIFSVTILSGLFLFIYRSVYLLVFVRFSFCSFVLFLFYLHSGWSYRDEFCFAVFFFFFSHYSGFGFLIIISNRFITLSFTCTSDEEREAKPKKRRKRTKELPKEDSSDDGNNDVNTFNMEHRLFLVMCLSSSCEVAVIQKKFKKTAPRVCSDDKRTT